MARLRLKIAGANFATARPDPLAADRLGSLGGTCAMWFVYIAMDDQCDVHDTNNECTHTHTCRGRVDALWPAT